VQHTPLVRAAAVTGFTPAGKLFPGRIPGGIDATQPDDG
jgi:hypothetical protein